MRIQPAVLKARCKVNLFLRVLSRRADGYHELETLFWPLDEPADTLGITPTPPGTGAHLVCADPALAGEGNLALRACRAFSKATGLAPDLEIHLVKGIPVGAGLGGGSSDAACMLRFLNAQAGDRGLPPRELGALAASLGADAPFFLQDRPALARGIGEDLTPLVPEAAGLLAGLHMVLVCPGLHVSTAWAYRALDEQRESRRGEFLTVLRPEAMGVGSRRFLALDNDFEGVVFPAHPELRAIKERLLMLGAGGALMSGSGSSVFALFRDGEKAEQAAQDAAAKAVVFVRQQ